jgi:hypothetical protein
LKECLHNLMAWHSNPLHSLFDPLQQLLLEKHSFGI